MVAEDSCPISVADLVGGWNGVLRIGADGRGVWEKDIGRAPIDVTATDTCGFFNVLFRDDKAYRAELSDGGNRLSFLDGNAWVRTSSVGPPRSFDSTCSLFKSCRCTPPPPALGSKGALLVRDGPSLWVRIGVSWLAQGKRGGWVGREWVGVSGCWGGRVGREWAAGERGGS